MPDTYTIPGDTQPLPAGWMLDDDDWGYREARDGDAERFNRNGNWYNAAFEDGRICVLNAATAIDMDAA